jgi:hypothetical protein
MRRKRVAMKRKLFGIMSASLLAYSMAGVIALAQSNMTQRNSLPLGRYTCMRVNGSSPLPDLKLLSKDRYENGNTTGIYVYEARAGRIEWLSGAISKQLVGFYIPKGVDNVAYDTIIVRDKKDVDEGNKRDLWKCSLAQ